MVKAFIGKPHQTLGVWYYPIASASGEFYDYMGVAGDDGELAKKNFLQANKLKPAEVEFIKMPTIEDKIKSKTEQVKNQDKGYEVVVNRPNEFVK